MDNTETRVLDHGFVRLVDHMGDDSSVVQSARVSYGDGTKTVRQDKGLIDYLIRNQHMSPLEMVTFTFHIKAPIFIARQWMRHRNSYNEMSGRYSVMKDEYYVPDPSVLQPQSKDNKQGRSGEFSTEDQEVILKEIIGQQGLAHDSYEALLGTGLARELARINQPLSLYTEFYWTVNLRSLFNFLKLRMDSHAQYEIRVYADAIYDMVKQIVPYAMESFEEHIRGSVTFSKTEMIWLQAVIGDTSGMEAVIQEGHKKKFQRFLEKIGK